MYTQQCVSVQKSIVTLIILALALFLAGCSSPTPTPVPTPYPTYTPVPPLPTYTPYPTLTPAPTFTLYPTQTPYPTHTPYPTPTSAPLAGKDQWVAGHFWSLKVVDVRTATELDGVRPLEDLFVVVEVDWKAEGTTEWHRIDGIDFEVVDQTGAAYDISGMIFLDTDAGPEQGPGEKYQEDSYRSVRARGTANDTYKLVFDVPVDAQGLKLWFQDFPLIDLGLEGLQ